MTATKTAAMDRGKISALADLITARSASDFDALVSELTTAEALKIGEKGKGTGLIEVSMHGITSTSTAGQSAALTNWANAARRKMLELAAEDQDAVEPAQQ